MRGNKKQILKIRTACKEAKEHLTAVYRTDITIDDLVDDDEPFEYDLTRAEFEEICSGIFDRCFPPVEQAIEDAGYTKDMIDEVLLVGGSSRIPGIQNKIKEFFDRDHLNMQLHPDEAVCYGPTLYSAMISGAISVEDFAFRDVIPLSMGTDIEDDGFSTIIPKNTLYPTIKKKSY